MKWGDEDWKFEAPTGDAVVVVLDDEPHMAMIITRIVTRRAPRCSVLHCPSSRTFRRALPQLGLGPVPVVTVWSDYNHLGHRGPEDLAFAAGAPSDLAPGGLRLAAAPQVLSSGYAREGSKEIPADFRGRAIHKPFAPQVVAEALLAHVQHLLAAARADLAASVGPVVRGAVAFGPRAVVAESVERMARVEAELVASLAQQGRGVPRT